MPFLSKYYEDIDLDSFVEKTVHEYSIFYEQEFDRKRIIVHTVEQREAMDYFCGRKTEDFVRASSNGNHIFYFSDESVGKETNGYHTFNQNKKIKMLRHEIGHNCFRRYRKGNGKPIFLNEGCSIYLSGQLEDKTPPKNFTLFLDYFETGGEGVYKESGYVVDLLIKEYGKPKFLKLLKETENKKKQGFISRRIYYYLLKNINIGIYEYFIRKALSTMKLIAGLGNPGTEYAKTRHNMGFIMLDLYCKEKTISGRKFEKKFNAEIIKTDDIIFCKPQTYMNKSGEAIKKIADYYKIDTENILIIHDEIDIPVGKIQKKIGGSPAGHNGLKSILQQLQNENTFTRIRVGIDRPQNKEDVVHYVLEAFSKDELNTILEKKEELIGYIQDF